MPPRPNASMSRTPRTSFADALMSLRFNTSSGIAAKRLPVGFLTGTCRRTDTVSLYRHSLDGISFQSSHGDDFVTAIREQLRRLRCRRTLRTLRLLVRPLVHGAPAAPDLAVDD